MARNGTGTYSRVNTFVAGTSITASAHNQNWADLENEITNSVAADGQTTMTGVLKHSNGTAAAPSMTFGSDADTGLYRAGADSIGVAIAGASIGAFGATGFVGLGGTPIGAVQDYAGSTAPTGWLLCYGQEISQTTYAGLYTVLSTNFNTGGEAAGNFRVPDCRGRTTAGKDNMGGSAASRLANAVTGSVSGTTLGATGGTESHTVTSAQMPAHIHTAIDAGHIHTAVDAGHIHTATDAGHTHTSGPGSVSGALSTASVRSDLAQATVLNAAQALSGISTGTGTASISVASSAAIITVGTNNAVITVGSTGGGAAHNNVQPTIIFNKIIFAGV